MLIINLPNNSPLSRLHSSGTYRPVFRSGGQHDLSTHLAIHRRWPRLGRLCRNSRRPSRQLL